MEKVFFIFIKSHYRIGATLCIPKTSPLLFFFKNKNFNKTILISIKNSNKLSLKKSCLFIYLGIF